MNNQPNCCGHPAYIESDICANCGVSSTCDECKQAECECPDTIDTDAVNALIGNEKVYSPEPHSDAVHSDNYVSDLDRITSNAGLAILLIIVFAVGGLMISGGWQ